MPPGPTGTTRSHDEISKAVIRLASGGLVAFPTETVYGLGADARNADAIARVFAMKGRPSNNPLIVHVSGAAMARRVVSSWPAAAERLAAAFWPGPLTLVLPRSAEIPGIVTGGGENVAVRAPDHPVTLALIERFGGPIVGPSANPSGRVSPTTAQHVRDSFAEAEVMVLDGGPCRGGIESTVVDLTSNPARVLRPGLITAQQLSGVLQAPVELAAASKGLATPKGGGPMASPGLLAQHYAPRTRAVLLTRDELARLLAAARDARTDARRIVALAISGFSVRDPDRVIGMPASPAAYAARLYAALREADDLCPELIAIERPVPSGDEAELWAAILDRLSRATA